MARGEGEGEGRPRLSLQKVAEGLASSPPLPRQVLGSVKNKIEGFAASQEDFPSLLFKARKYLIARARPDGPDATNPLPPLRRPEALGERGGALGEGGSPFGGGWGRGRGSTGVACLSGGLPGPGAQWPWRGWP